MPRTFHLSFLFQHTIQQSKLDPEFPFIVFLLDVVPHEMEHLGPLRVWALEQSTDGHGEIEVELPTFPVLDGVEA